MSAGLNTLLAVISGKGRGGSSVNMMRGVIRGRCLRMKGDIGVFLNTMQNLDSHIILLIYILRRPELARDCFVRTMDPLISPR